MRTGHGSADLAVDVHDAAATVGDLLALITGRSAPSTVLVDGAVVGADEPLLGLPAGSLIDTDVGTGRPRTPPPAAELLQLTGPGAGTIRPLAPGRFRIGSGSRINAPELATGRVVHSAFEIDVGPDSTRVGPAAGTAALDGVALDHERPWTTQLLTADGRTFAHARRPRLAATTEAASRSVDDDGRVALRRPVDPGGDGGPRLGLVDARRDAEQLRPGLWRDRRRRGTPLGLDVGLHAETSATVTADVGAPLVLLGPAGVRRSHARAVVLDAATRCGPADLDVVVAAEEPSTWDWVKWLPHVATDRSAGIQLYGDDATGLGSLASLAHRVDHPPRGGADRRRTLLVVDGDRFWQPVGAPLHRLATEPPADVAVVLVTARNPTEARRRPGTTIAHPPDGAPGQARLTYPHGGVIDLRAPLPSVQTASAIARHLTAVVDADRPAPACERTPTHASHTLAEAVGGDRSGVTPAVRWHTQVGSASPASLRIGRTPSAPVEIDVGAHRGVVIGGSTLADAADVARTILASMATTWSPRELAVVHVDHSGAAPTDPVTRFPHWAGTFSEHGARAGRRLAARLATELLAPTPTARRMVVLVDGLDETAVAAPGLVEGLSRLAAAASGIHLVVATDRPLATLDDALLATCPVRVTVDCAGGRRHASVQHGRSRTPFVPVSAARPPGAALEVTPYTFGRQLTGLERHVVATVPGRHGDDRLDDELAVIGEQLRTVATLAAVDTGAPLVPEPLPTSVAADELPTADGDGAVPFGLAAPIGSDSVVPVSWRPGPAGALVAGSLVAVGSPPVGALVDVVLAGVAAAPPPGDFELFVIDPDDERRSALDHLPCVRGTASPIQLRRVDALLGSITAELHQRALPSRRAGGVHQPQLLVVRAVEQLSPKQRRAVRALLDGGAPVGINVVAATASAAAALDVAAPTTPLVVGALDDPDDVARLGITDPGDLRTHPGRAVFGPTQTLVQIATPPQRPAVQLGAPVVADPASGPLAGVGSRAAR